MNNWFTVVVIVVQIIAVVVYSREVHSLHKISLQVADTSASNVEAATRNLHLLEELQRSFPRVAELEARIELLERIVLSRRN